ncbi:MAG: TIM barrel protein [Candidatus Lustribacter sp.]
MARLSANLSWLFTELPLRERFAAAAAHGFRAVEILWPYELPPEEIAAALQAHDLELVLINLPPGEMAQGERGFAARPGDEARFTAGLETALGYARTCGCTRLHAMSGVRIDGVPPAAHDDTLVANLTRAAAPCAAAGITLTIEPLNAKENPTYILQSTAQAIAILDRVAQPNVALQFDFYHVFHTEGHAIERAHELRGRFAHVQIAGCPDRHEPEGGELDVTRALAQLDADGYAGYVGLEYKPRAATAAGLAWATPYLRGAAPRA